MQYKKRKDSSGKKVKDTDDNMKGKMGTSSRINTALIALIVFLFFCCAVLIGLYMIALKESTCIVTEEEEYELGDKGDVEFWIDSYTEIEGKGWIISGWCVFVGETYSMYNYGLDKHFDGVYNNMHLSFVDHEKVYVAPTQLVLRNDVSNAINDGNNYQFCGFRSFIPDSFLSNIDEKNCKMAMLSNKLDGKRIVYIFGKKWGERGN